MRVWADGRVAEDTWVEPSAMVTVLTADAGAVASRCEATKRVLTKLLVAPQSRRYTAG
jgi:hypothetical protein